MGQLCDGFGFLHTAVAEPGLWSFYTTSGCFGLNPCAPGVSLGRYGIGYGHITTDAAGIGGVAFFCTSGCCDHGCVVMTRRGNSIRYILIFAHVTGVCCITLLCTSGCGNHRCVIMTRGCNSIRYILITTYVTSVCRITLFCTRRPRYLGRICMTFGWDLLFLCIIARFTYTDLYTGICAISRNTFAPIAPWMRCSRNTYRFGLIAAITNSGFQAFGGTGCLHNFNPNVTAVTQGLLLIIN